MLGQVPTVGESDTLPCLTVLAKGSSKEEAKGGDRVVDVAICWNYLVVADSEGITKYGLVNNKPSLERLDNPPGCRGIRQASATPRYILTVTDQGHCWTNEEGKVRQRLELVGSLSLSNILHIRAGGGLSSPQTPVRQGRGRRSRRRRGRRMRGVVRMVREVRALWSL